MSRLGECEKEQSQSCDWSELYLDFLGEALFWYQVMHLRKYDERRKAIEIGGISIWLDLLF